jgi:hypothetical protein
VGKLIVTKSYSSLFLVIFLSFLAIFSKAQADYCPKKIAAIEGDPLAAQGGEILKKIYQELGCPIDLIYLPGQRGILHFNGGKVDGELYRLRLVEGAYERKFVRSDVALFPLTNDLWVHPDPKVAETKAFGYVLGLKWHEAYIQKNALKIKKLAQFPSEEKLFAAYNRGAIGSFLSEKQTIDVLEKTHKLVQRPLLKEVVETKSLYHYLGDEFTPFMNDFSRRLQQDNPFSVMK